MDLGLKDKVAVVTGAGSQTGFGKGIALTLAQEGCDVIIMDKDGEGAEKTAVEVEATGRRALSFKVDVTKSDEVNKAVKSAFSSRSYSSANLGMNTFTESLENWLSQLLRFSGSIWAMRALISPSSQGTNRVMLYAPSP